MVAVFTSSCEQGSVDPVDASTEAVDVLPTQPHPFEQRLMKRFERSRLQVDQITKRISQGTGNSGNGSDGSDPS